MVLALDEEYSDHLTLGKAQKLEMASDKWATPENLEIHYKVLSDVLIETVLAVAAANPLFEPTVK